MPYLAMILASLRTRATREAGFTPILVMVSVAIVAALTLVVGNAIVSINSTMATAAAQRQAYARSEQFEARLSAEAGNAKAIFTPAVAVDGAANCDGSGNCRELDLLSGTTTTSGQSALFVAYIATATGGVQRYTYTDTNASAAPTGVVADGAPIGGKQLFFRDVAVTALASDPDTTPTTKAHITALGITPRRWTFQLEHADVVATNDVFYVHYDPGTGVDVFPVSGKVKPLSNVLVANGTYAPPAAPPIDFGGGSGSLTFAYPSAPSQTFGVHEQNYHDPFTLVGGCSSSGATIAVGTPSSALPNPNPINPPNQDSGPATFTMGPAQPGLCSQVVQSVYGQTIVEQVQVMGPLQVAPNTVTLSVAGAASTYPTSAGVIVTKTFDQAAIIPTFSGCSGIATATAGAPSYPASPSGTPSSLPITISAIAPGSCTLSVGDQYGEVQTVAVNVFGALTVNPPTMTFANASASAQNAVANEGNYRGTITIANGSPSCAGYANASPGSQNTDGAFNAAFSISPVAPVNPCVFVVSDDHGGSATVQVIIQNPTTTCPDGTVVGFGTPCPVVTPPPATPTPTPPPPCVLDSYGYCANPPRSSGSKLLQTANCVPASGASSYNQPYFEGAISNDYDIYDSSGLLGTYNAADNYYYSGDPCNPQVIDRTWTPSDPALTYADPNLP